MCLYLAEIRYNFDLSSVWKAYLGHWKHVLITEFWIFEILGIGNSTMTHKRIFQRHHVKPLLVLSLPKMPLCPLSTPPPPSVKSFIFLGLVQRPPFPQEAFFLNSISPPFPPPPPTHSGPKYGLFTSESPVLKPSFYMCVLVSSPLDNNTHNSQSLLFSAFLW